MATGTAIGQRDVAHLEHRNHTNIGLSNHKVGIYISFRRRFRSQAGLPAATRRDASALLLPLGKLLRGQLEN
eukprot:COSAG02_NODE_736_length_17865_cov_9.190420_14_plen_72_part_00